jgi:hypothetical protein
VLGMMLERNVQIPNAIILHQMVHSTRNNQIDRIRLHLVTQSTTDFVDQLDPQSRELISNVHKAFKKTLEVR